MKSLRNCSGVGDVAERRALHAGAGEGDVAVVEEAPEDALVDLDALHLRDEELHGLPLDQAGLRDHALVGDRELGGGVADPRPDEQEQADDHRQEQHAEEEERREGPFADARPVHDLLAGDENAFNIGSHRAAV
jgi:hypothetical protein